MFLQSAFHQLFCLKFSFKLVTFSKSCARKQKWVFFSEPSVYRGRVEQWRGSLQDETLMTTLETIYRDAANITRKPNKQTHVTKHYLTVCSNLHHRSNNKYIKQEFLRLSSTRCTKYHLCASLKKYKQKRVFNSGVYNYRKLNRTSERTLSKNCYEQRDS